MSECDKPNCDQPASASVVIRFSCERCGTSKERTKRRCPQHVSEFLGISRAFCPPCRTTGPLIVFDVIGFAGKGADE